MARQQGLDLGFESSEVAVFVDIDLGLMREALVNLLNNATQHTPRGGQITVALRIEKGCAVLAVQDSGSGIPPDEIDKAGQRFYRASNANRTGSGLGLSIVRAILHRHNGELVLRSGPSGKGLEAALCFYVFYTSPETVS
jgi:two-component system sensor histidine kinase TctE